MIKENSFIYEIKNKVKNLSLEDEWIYRKHFKGLTKKEKKKADSKYVREKNKLNFSDWLELVAENQKVGRHFFEENKNNVKLSTQYNRHRSKLNDPKFRDYLGLQIMNENDLERVKINFKENTGIEYPI